MRSAMVFHSNVVETNKVTKQIEHSEYLVWQLPVIFRVVSEIILENCCGHGITESCLCPLLEGQVIGFSSATALDPVMCL